MSRHNPAIGAQISLFQERTPHGYLFVFGRARTFYDPGDRLGTTSAVVGAQNVHRLQERVLRIDSGNRLLRTVLGVALPGAIIPTGELGPRVLVLGTFIIFIRFCSWNAQFTEREFRTLLLERFFGELLNDKMNPLECSNCAFTLCPFI